MHSFLKQSTASQSRAIGPFLDDTDFKTAETGLTVANTDIKLVVNGAASANKNSGGGTHRVNGVYGVTFDATDTATVGEMHVSVVVAGALPVFATFVVVEEAVYDQLFGASALGYIANAPVNVAQFGGSNLTSTSGIPAVNSTQLNSSATAAAKLTLAVGGTINGTVDATVTPTTSVFETSSITEATADHFVGRIVLWLSGALLYQQALITAYSLNSGRGQFTVTTMTDAPSNGDSFIVV